MTPLVKSPAPPPRKVIVGHYAVAYIDLLGQTNALSRLRVPKPGEDSAPVIQALKESAGVVHSIRDAFDFFYREAGAGPSPEFLATIPPERQDWFLRLRERPAPSLLGFSDSFVIACSLAIQPDAPPTHVTNGLDGMLTALAGISLIALSQGVALRGGVAVGVGTNYLSDAEIYGPVLGEAYKLESAIAQYPRIVVHENVRQHLDYLRTATWPDEDATQVMRAVAERASNLICKAPDDGRPMVHFLSSQIPLLPHFEDAPKDAARWAREQRLDHLRKGRWKLARRYARLNQYFETHLGTTPLKAKELVGPYSEGIRRAWAFGARR